MREPVMTRSGDITVVRKELDRLTALLAAIETERNGWKAAHDDLYDRLTHMQAEIERLREDNRRLAECWDTAIEAEKIALREIGAENERLREDNKRAWAAYWDLSDEMEDWKREDDKW